MPLTDFQKASFRHGIFSSEQVIDPDTGEPISTGEQRIRLLGPFPFTYQSAGLFDTGFKLTDLEAGTTVVRAWLITTTAFNGNTSALTIGIGDASTGDWVGVAVYDAPSGFAASTTSGGDRVERETILVSVAEAVTACDIVVGGSASDTSYASAGASSVYALIAEPA